MISLYDEMRQETVKVNLYDNGRRKRMPEMVSLLAPPSLDGRGEQPREYSLEVLLYVESEKC